MTDSRNEMCVLACKGIGTGELAAILEEDSTLKEHYDKVIEQRAAAQASSRRLRGVLSEAYSAIKKMCCGTVLEKDPLLTQIQDALVGTSTPGYEYHRRVVCAANLYEDGLMLIGARHWDTQMHLQADRIGFVRKEHGAEQQGFIDQHGKFMTREEAWVVAWNAGQIIRRCGGDDRCLYSENLY